MAVRWYLRFSLSYRDVEELLAERGIEVDHVTIYRWVQRFTPLLAEAARPSRHAVGDRWQVDETYVKVAGQWRYVYRAIDQFGQVIDVFVSPRRDVRAARRFFERAIGATTVRPSEVVTDRAPTYPMGHCCIWPEGAVGGSKVEPLSRPDGCQECSTQSVLASPMAFRDSGGGRRFEWTPDAIEPLGGPTCSPAGRDGNLLA